MYRTCYGGLTDIHVLWKTRGEALFYLLQTFGLRRISVQRIGFQGSMKRRYQLSFDGWMLHGLAQKVKEFKANLDLAETEQSETEYETNSEIGTSQETACSQELE